jgi:hypothetical protein
MFPPQVKEMTGHGNWDRHDSSLETDEEGQTREVAYTPPSPPTTTILREKETLDAVWYFPRNLYCLNELLTGNP